MQSSATDSQPSQLAKWGQYPGVWRSGCPIRVLTPTGRPYHAVFGVDLMMLPMFCVGVAMSFGPEQVVQDGKKNREPRGKRGWISNHKGQALAQNGLASRESSCFGGEGGLQVVGSSSRTTCRTKFSGSKSLGPGPLRQRGGLAPISPIFLISAGRRLGKRGKRWTLSSRLFDAVEIGIDK